MLEIIHNDIYCTVAIHPILLEEQCHTQKNTPVINVKSIKRKCEWLTTHKVLHELLLEQVTYKYDSLGKPILNNRNERVSISHSRNYSAVIVSNEKRVGIDIEELNPRILKISKKFINLSEQIFIDNQNLKTELLYLIWCAKEALYKLSETYLDFKEHIFIEDFILSNSGSFNAKTFHPENTQQYTLSYRLTEKFVLVWVVE